MNNKYIDSKIYKLIDNTNGNIYIGSTYKTIEDRLSRHRSDYKRYLNGKFNYVSSFEIIKNGNYSIEIIELFSCINKKELFNREGYYIRTLECVNKNVAGRTKKEKYEQNKDVVLEKNKEWREINKDTLKQKRKQKFICICGIETAIDSKARHFRSITHINYMVSITE